MENPFTEPAQQPRLSPKRPAAGPWMEARARGKASRIRGPAAVRHSEISPRPHGRLAEPAARQYISARPSYSLALPVIKGRVRSAAAEVQRLGIMKRLDRSVVGAAAECGVRRAEVVAVDSAVSAAEVVAVDSAASAAVAAEVVVEDTPTEEADIHLAVTASQHGKSNS